MMLMAVHVICAAIWFGTAMTLPFWGNRMNRAGHLDTVLGVMDTVYLLKVVYIMGGLTLTLGSGVWLTLRLGWPFFSAEPAYHWLTMSQGLSLPILFNSCVLLVLMTLGRKGRRSLFRAVPVIGYNNIALILLVYLQMILRPLPEQQWYLLYLPLTLLLLADLLFIGLRLTTLQRLRRMSPQQFIDLYFNLLREERMAELFRLFRDDAVFNDPFATGPVRGIKAIERFFQSLGEQFEHIEIRPLEVNGDRTTIHTQWVANGLTKNGQPLHQLIGSNRMQRHNGKIRQVDIDFDLGELPSVTRVSVDSL
jgi:uncharacterized membrane protein